MSTTRYARVFGSGVSEDRVAPYLPGNYEVLEGLGCEDGRDFVTIAGEDNAGWTLDDYVIPRLASGLWFAKEVDLSIEPTIDAPVCETCGDPTTDKDSHGTLMCLDCQDESLPVAVVDMDSASEPGETFTVVARFSTEQEAVSWLGQHEDQEKVERGGFGVDVPEPCCYVAFQTRGKQHHITCEEY